MSRALPLHRRCRRGNRRISASGSGWATTRSPGLEAGKDWRRCRRTPRPAAGCAFRHDAFAVDDESGRQRAAIGDGAAREGRRRGRLAAAAGLRDPGEAVHAGRRGRTGRQGRLDGHGMLRRVGAREDLRHDSPDIERPRGSPAVASPIFRCVAILDGASIRRSSASGSARSTSGCPGCTIVANAHMPRHDHRVVGRDRTAVAQALVERIDMRLRRDESGLLALVIGARIIDGRG